MRGLVGYFLTLVSLILSMVAQSAEFDQKKLHFGGGIAFNTSPANTALGYQWFTGYDFSQYVDVGQRLGFSAELGYTNSGDMTPIVNSSLNGIWANAVASYRINTKVNYINRLGLDFGDAFFTMMGMGVEYAVDEHIAARGEIVMRGGYKSYQLNLLYRF